MFYFSTESVVLMSNVVNLKDDREHSSNKGTFEVSVKFMQNATWQGQIHWIEKNQKQNFRSVLEMLKLMDEALTGSAEEELAVNW